MTRLSDAFAKPHPAFFCFRTAGDGDTANQPGAPLCSVRIPSATDRLWTGRGEDLRLNSFVP